MEALLIVDVQNDFSPTGALPVREGDQVVSFINAIMPEFERVVASQDWHPSNHQSFAVNHPHKKPGDLIMLQGVEQILWPSHCVQNSSGAAFMADLNISGVHKIFQKGMNPQIDSYSCFFDNDHKQATGLNQYLKAQGVKTISVAGLATDYCVKYTALDAVSLGYEVKLLLPGCRGVNLNPNDVTEAIIEMKKAGVTIIE